MKKKRAQPRKATPCRADLMDDEDWPPLLIFNHDPKLTPEEKRRREFDFLMWFADQWMTAQKADSSKPLEQQDTEGSPNPPT